MLNLYHDKEEFVMNRTIAVDTGKFATKALMRRTDGTERFLSFRTKMQETRKTEVKGKSFIVEYKNKRYLLGEQAEVISSKTTKAEEMHRIATYTTLAQLADSGDNIVVVLGCPLSVYENAESKRQYKEYMFPERQIHIKVNDTTKHLNITSVIVLPESSGVIYLEQELCEKAVVGIIDIGGLNVNCCVYNKTVPVLPTLYTDNLGSNVLLQELKNALAIKYNEDIPDWMMEDVLTQGYLTDNMSLDGVRVGSREFIREFKQNHIHKIIQKCEANHWNLRTTRLIFSGGTSELLKEEIKTLLPGATILAEPAKANVRGFLKAVIE